MPRPLRQELAGGVFHVFARGNDKRPIYLDDRDRVNYLQLLAKTVRMRNWHCMSYCLMGNHVHFLVETPIPNLGAGMQQLHGTYARRFNDRYGRSGHLFEGRFRAVPIKTDAQMQAVIRYIALNPVEANLCRRPEEYEWSSHAAMLSGDTPAFLDADRTLWYLASLGGDPRATYSNLINDALWV